MFHRQQSRVCLHITTPNVLNPDTIGNNKYYDDYPMKSSCSYVFEESQDSHVTHAFVLIFKVFVSHLQRFHLLNHALTRTNDPPQPNNNYEYNCYVPCTI